jgi:hypothetical protein
MLNADRKLSLLVICSTTRVIDKYNMKNPTWLPLSFVFWVGATVPLIVAFTVEADIPNALAAGASTAVIPTLIFSCALSNCLNFKLPNIRACALLGLSYGAGHAIVVPASLHFLTQQLSAHIQLAHIVNALYMFVVPWWIAKISSRCTRSLPDINQ